MIDRAHELIREAQRSAKNNNLGDVLNISEYQEAIRLLKEADPLSIDSLKDQLRSNSLRSFSMSDYGRKTLAERKAIVEDIANRRAALLKIMGRYPASLQTNLTEGRILLHAPNDNLSDGAATYPSKGFFDVNNVPPWDTWVCYVDSYLVSWVPPVLEELVSAGIAVNPEECIRWAGPAFVNSLFGVDGK